MTSDTAPMWTEMTPAEFDGRRATAAQRRVIETAADTLFPRLLPDAPRKAAPAPAEMAGQGDLFGGLA